MVKIKVEAWQQKEQILKNKNKLKRSQIFVEFDLTEWGQKI